MVQRMQHMVRVASQTLHPLSIKTAAAESSEPWIHQQRQVYASTHMLTHNPRGSHCRVHTEQN